MNIASVVGVVGNAGQANYSAAKAGVSAERQQRCRGKGEEDALMHLSRVVACRLVCPRLVEAAEVQAERQRGCTAAACKGGNLQVGSPSTWRGSRGADGKPKKIQYCSYLCAKSMAQGRGHARGRGYARGRQQGRPLLWEHLGTCWVHLGVPLRTSCVVCLQRVEAGSAAAAYNGCC